MAEPKLQIEQRLDRIEEAIERLKEPDNSLGPEGIAKKFHETYESLAPTFGYKTRDESAVSWENVPEQNRNLMVAVVSELLEQGVIH